MIFLSVVYEFIIETLLCVKYDSANNLLLESMELRCLIDKNILRIFSSSYFVWQKNDNGRDELTDKGEFNINEQTHV